MNIDEIRALIGSGDYEFSLHAQQERLAEDLDVADIEAAVLAGEVLEDYPNDSRGPSCLVCGNAGNRAVHVVIGWAHRQSEGKRTLRVITVYVPQPPKWKDTRTRGGLT